MLYISFEGNSDKNLIRDIVRLFYKDDEISYAETELPEAMPKAFLLSKAIVNGNNFISEVTLKADDYNHSDSFTMPCQSSKISENDARKNLDHEIKKQVYIALSDYAKKKQPWGMLTGIRPTKIIHQLIKDGLNKEEIFRKFEDYYLVSQLKTELAYDIAQTEKSILDSSGPKSIGIYIGIPFCRTKCLYCSFTSNSIEKYKHLTDKYIEALCSEITEVSKIINEKEFRIQSIYIGGGTPTSLTGFQLKQLLDFVESKFDLQWLEEYSLEAGRPDSIDEEKLSLIKESRVDRISINPQSMNDETLRLIGRNHSAKEVIEAFKLARKFGFDNINMDIIVGLPGETLKMFCNTLDEIKKLAPESLTVHTMAVKRASRLNEDKGKYKFISSEDASKMVETAADFANSIGMHPYYLYRQKNVLGNLENVGYCKPSAESIYNIQIMEEMQTIIALGAGAVTKFVDPESGRIERAFNVKNVEEYISRVDEMVERKRLLL